MEALPDDPLGRKPGERLWPEWFTDAMVETAKRDPRAWNALYQQRPVVEEGDYFKLFPRIPMGDDFEHLFASLVDIWDREFPASDTSYAADLEAADLLADFNKLIRRTRERLAREH